MAASAAAAPSDEFRLLFPPAADGGASAAAATATAPLVVCLGWFGADDRHLAKYCALLARSGYPILRGTLPGAAVFSPFAWPRRRFARRLLDAIDATVDPSSSQRIVFYVFSNGGGFVLEQLTALLRDDPARAALRARVAGCVFDSAPCWMSPFVGAAALGQGRPWPLRLLGALAFFASLLIMLPFAPRRPWDYWRSMRELGGLTCSSLYLYSADDPLCLVDRLDALLAARRADGVDVAAVRWETSRHVGHLLCHPREYKAALLGFLQRVSGAGGAGASAGAAPAAAQAPGGGS